MSRRQRFLGAIAHPQIAYLLLTLGILGLTVELWNPGAVLPGVAGGLSLLLAFFAFQVLPVNAAGLLLILFGIGLLVLELKVPSFGALGVGGAISLFFGSVLMTRGVPGVQVGLGAIVPAVLVLAGGRAAARPAGTGGAAAAAGHRRRRADRSTGAGADRRSSPASVVMWPSTANSGGRRATIPIDGPADSLVVTAGQRPTLIGEHRDRLSSLGQETLHGRADHFPDADPGGGRRAVHHQLDPDPRRVRARRDLPPGQAAPTAQRAGRGAGVPADRPYRADQPAHRRP